MEKPIAVPSPVGEVIDVATPAARKLQVLGLLWTVIALATFVFINYLIIESLAGDDPIFSRKHPISFVGAPLFVFICWFALGSAVQRFHAARAKRYFRAGPGGVSVCVPDDRGNTFRFSFQTIKFDLSWEQIRTWYPFVQSMNGIPTERAMVFETLDGTKLKIKTYHFAERQKQITTNLTRARSLTMLAANETISACPAAEQNNAAVLPPGAGELSIEIKKKREPVKEIDLRTIHVTQRAMSIQRIADLLETKIAVICPGAAGFKVSRKQYQPFKEWKHVFGIRLLVRRGLLDGYEIQIEPRDSESRQLMISMSASSLIGDIRRYASMAIGAILFVVSFTRLREISHWLGEFSQLTPLVMVAVLIAAIGLCTALLELPIRLVRLLVSNKQKQEAQKRELKLGIQEMAM
jgi:hypothetical protein